MLVYHINSDGTPGETVELPDDTTVISAEMTFCSPPTAGEGMFVVFDRIERSWRITANVPLAQAAPDLGSIVTVLAFRRRFTAAERQAVELASLDDPSADMGARAQAAAIRTSQKDIEASEYIDLRLSEVVDGVRALEIAGLLAKGRADEILLAKVTEQELPELFKGRIV